MTTFDIALKVVKPEQKAFVVHAGRARRNFSEFYSHGAAFLEIPGLNLDDVDFKIRSQVRQAIRRWIAHERYNATPDTLSSPSVLLNDFSKEVFENAHYTKLAGSIVSLYGRAKVGDVIITPGFEMIDGYKTPIVLFGEIIAPFSKLDVTTAGGKFAATLPMRKVKWRNKVLRKDISPAVDSHISRPPAVREIKIEPKTEEIFSFTYENYVFESSSASKIEANKYEATKFPDFVDVNGLIAFFIAAHTAIQAAGGSEIAISDIDAFTKANFHHTGIENIQLDFASPGFWRIVGGGATLATFVALSLAVFSGSVDLSKIAEGIKVTNSVAATDDDDQKMQESFNILFRSLDMKTKKEIQRRVDSSEKSIGLKSSVRVADE